MAKFTAGRLGVPGAVNGVATLTGTDTTYGVFCFGPFGVGVVVHRVRTWASCYLGTGVGLSMALALVRTSHETEENFRSGVGLCQGGGVEVMGQRGYRQRVNSRNWVNVVACPQVEVRSSQVWVAWGWKVVGDGTIDGWLAVETVWPGFYGGERSVEIREAGGE